MALEKKQNGRKSLPALASDNTILKLLTLFIENADDYAILLLDSNGMVLNCNRGAEQLSGYACTEIIGFSFTLFYTKEDIKNHKPQIILDTALKQGNYEEDCWQVRKDGSRYIANILTTSIYDKDKNHCSFGIIIQDITEQKLAEETLMENKKKLKAVYENSGIAIMLLNENGFIDCNSRALEIFGIKRKEDFINVHPAKLSAPFQVDGTESFEAAQKKISTAFQTGFNRFEWIHRHANGQDFPAEITLTAFDYDEEHLLLASIKDISQNKKSEEALWESENRFRSLVETTSDWIWETDARGVYTYSSPSVENILGYTTKEILGKTPFDFILPEESEKIAAIFQRIFANREPIVRLENTNRHKDGRLAILETNAAPFFNFSGQILGYRGVNRDITERKLAEGKISYISKVQNLILENSTMGIAFVRNRTFEWANSRLAELLRLSIGQLQNAPTRIIYPSDEMYEDLGKTAYQTMSKGKRSDSTYQLQRGDRTLFWCRFIGKALNPANPNEGSIWMIEDITKRIQAEEALKKSQANLQALIENTDDRVWSVDCNYNFTTINSNLQQDIKTIYEIELKMGDNISVLPPSLYIPWKERYDRALQGETFTIIDQYPSESTNAYVEISLHPIYMEKQITGVTCFSRDITQKKVAEEALRLSRSKLTLAMDIAKLANWEYDVKSNLFLHNDRFYALYGTTVEEQGGQYISPEDYARKFVHPEDINMVKDEIDKALATDDPNYSNQVEHRIVRTDGKIRYVVVRYIIQKDESGKTIKTYGVNQDITDQKKNEFELRDLNATKDKFFSIIAHDLKTPFNSIIGFSDLMVEQIQEKNYEEIDEYARIIKKSSLQAMDLLMNLLEWSRLQTGKIKFNPESIKIASLINEVTELLIPSAQHKSISISKEIQQNILVIVDKYMVSTILRNLISNAIKFTNPGGKIVISVEYKQNELMITVSDNGVGIPKDTLGKLFQLGENNSTTGTQNEKGTGLGLLLCKDFVEKHGGKIWAESELGKGSIFKFILPAGF